MYVERNITDRFSRLERIQRMVAVVGPRQAGKTTFLQHQMKGRDASYVLFDRLVVRDLFEKDVEKFEMEYLTGRELAVLDEVQYCKEAGRKLKYLVDTGSKLWLTSSSERVLAKEVLAHLVGRVVVLRLLPFDLDEFLRARGHRVMSELILEKAVWEHMLYGGYPLVVLAEDGRTKQDLLRSILETMLLKDVALTFGIDKTAELERLARYIALSVGSRVDYQAMCSTLELTYPTLKKYLDAMEKSYLTVTVLPFFRNKRSEISRQPKIYFMDPGLRNASAGRFITEPEGPAFENYVLTELLKLGHTPRYWRSKGNSEVDFVVETEDGVVPVEAKLRVVPGRVTRGLRSFITAFKPQQAFMVGYRADHGKQRMDGAQVMFTDVAGLREGIGRGTG